jgi:hypothetical protein
MSRNNEPWHCQYQDISLLVGGHEVLVYCVKVQLKQHGSYAQITFFDLLDRLSNFMPCFNVRPSTSINRPTG